jgi:hypothetical protein
MVFGVLQRGTLYTWAKDMALLIVPMSESLVASRDWARSSTGFRITVTAAASTPRIATTIRSSIRVKPFLRFGLDV